MKAGDELVVQMEGFHVANAVIEEISNGEAVIFIPATRIIMGVEESLVDKAPEGTERTILEDTNGFTSVPPRQEVPDEPTSTPQASTSQSEPSTGQRLTQAQKEIQDAYNGAQSLSEVPLNSDAIDKD